MSSHPEDHPFADKGTKPAVVTQLPFADSTNRSITEIVPKGLGKNLPKRTAKVREEETYSVISKSLSNVKMSEQLFASNKKQVIFGSVPSKSNCYRIVTFKSKDVSKQSHSTMAKTPALAKYEKDFFIQCNVYRNKDLQGYLQIEVDVYYPNQRSDLDNSLKVILDCLQKVKAFANDNKVVDIRIRKFLDKANPRVEFSLKEAM